VTVPTGTLLALCALGASLLAGPSGASPPPDGPSGPLCDFLTDDDPRSDDVDDLLVEIDGGPLVVTDPAGQPAGGTLTCSVQVGYATHAGPDVATASAHGDGVVVLPASVHEVTAPPNAAFYWCTQFAYDGGPTLYWVPRHETPYPEHWTTDPNEPCDYLDDVGHPEDDLGEQASCLGLRALGGALGLDDPNGAVYVTPEGDTFVEGTFVWDCYPYEQG
jgi:hypothetical protein